MGDRSSYMSPGGYNAASTPGGANTGGSGGGGYAREDYALGGSSGGGGGDDYDTCTQPMPGEPAPEAGKKREKQPKRKEKKMKKSEKKAEEAKQERKKVEEAKEKVVEVAAVRHIEEEEYYHGLLPREDMEMLLRNRGDFLVRLSEDQVGHRVTILSVMADKLRHVIVQQLQNGKRALDGQADERRQFDSVPELIDTFVKKGFSIIPKEPNVALLKAINRPSWELRRENIELGEKLGEGAFGEVRKGLMKTVSGKRKPIEVAVKLSKDTEMSKEKIKEMMKEARLMRNFDHENVVRIFGVCVDREPLMIVMELIEGGALGEYLRKTKVPIAEKVDHMTVGAAWGLEYLHGQHCIHRDVAARNCLYANKTVKISDFGMSREGDEYRPTTAQRAPIKWLAPETLLSGVYTPMSDVWSFGVMVHEIFSDGSEPYPGMSNAMVKEKIAGGYKMTFPEETPQNIADLVTNYCWAFQPTERMTMTDIVKRLEEITGVRRARR